LQAASILVDEGCDGGQEAASIVADDGHIVRDKPHGPCGCLWRLDLQV
jgi:hypothetical protein